MFGDVKEIIRSRKSKDGQCNVQQKNQCSTKHYAEN